MTRLVFCPVNVHVPVTFFFLFTHPGHQDLRCAMTTKNKTKELTAPVAGMIRNQFNLIFSPFFCMFLLISYVLFQMGNKSILHVLFFFSLFFFQFQIVNGEKKSFIFSQFRKVNVIKRKHMLRNCV